MIVVFRMIPSLVFIMWLCFIGYVSLEFATHFNESQCVGYVSTVSLILGCFCLLTSAYLVPISNIFNWHIIVRKRSTSLSQFIFLVNAMATLLCLANTATGYIALRMIKCVQFDPSQTPLIIVFAISMFNHLVGVDQFSETGWLIFNDDREMELEDERDFTLLQTVEMTARNTIHLMESIKFPTARTSDITQSEKDA